MADERVVLIVDDDHAVHGNHADAAGKPQWA
jgi:hypothetical protein